MRAEGENSHHHMTPPHTNGRIEVICGSMFSGKTEELIRRLKRAKIARKKIIVFKHSIDTRYHARDIVSHNKTGMESIPVTQAQDILRHVSDHEVIGVDEAQFFDADIIDILNQLANQGKRIIVAGLEKDYQANPFGSLPVLMAIAEQVTKLRAICVVCGENASFSYRKTKENTQLLVGEADHYEPRCRNCYYLHETEDRN